MTTHFQSSRLKVNPDRPGLTVLSSYAEADEIAAGASINEEDTDFFDVPELGGVAASPKNGDVRTMYSFCLFGNKLVTKQRYVVQKWGPDYWSTTSTQWIKC